MRGMLDLGQLRDLASKGEIETVVVGFTDHYGRLLGKRFDAEMFVEEICSQGAHACDYLLTVDMEMEPVPGYRFASWELGYGDFHLVPDLGTLRLASWLEKTALVLCDVKSEKTHDLVGVAPRSILRQQVDAASALGYSSYAGALEMADRHVVFKQCLKELAEAAGMSLTFMAKFAADRAGSSCHIHFSLWRDGKNVFEKGGEVFRWFLGGWIAHVPDVMVFYAPTINSYKRYVDASWAPTRLAWSYDNRTAGFRVVGNGQSLRIECRIPGADCNPYLALAASLASGLDGIAGRLEPPECFVGDVYAAKNLPRVPYTLGDAVNLFSRSEFTKRAFGDEVVEHYSHFFRTEAAAFDTAVTDWEHKRYFERI